MARSMRGVLIALLTVMMAILVALVVMPLPHASAATMPDLVEAGVVTDGTRPDNPIDWGEGIDAVIVLTPGTDDGTLIERTNGIVGTRTTYVVQYPESFWPLISGKSGAFLPLFAPTYDKSSSVAVSNNLAVMRALHANPPGKSVVYTGYSQGAEALGNAAELGYAEGVLGGNSVILLVSDPRSPWGAKQWLASMPVLPHLSGLIGITSNGARDPGATGNVNVQQVILTGDPAANMQWVWYRPMSSMLVNAAGFLTVHSGRGPQHYGNIPELGEPTVYKSADGNTTYSVYKTAHPLALMQAVVYDTVGVKYTDDDLQKWDAGWQKFYQIQEPTPGNAAVPVEPVAPTVVTQQNAPVAASDSDNSNEPAVSTQDKEPMQLVETENDEVVPADTSDTDDVPVETVDLTDSTADTDATSTDVVADQTNEEASASDYDLAG